MVMWKIECLNMFNAPLLFLKEKEMEDEVKKMNKETIVQECDANEA